MHQESIRKKTGYVVMRADGIYDVDANTSIDQLSEDLNVKLPEVISFFILFVLCQYALSSTLKFIVSARDCAIIVVVGASIFYHF